MTMKATPELAVLLLTLRKVSAVCNSERELQERVGMMLGDLGIPFQREHKLADGGGRVDFYIPGALFKIAIETKTKDSRANVLRQLKQYADSTEVEHIIVMSRQPLSLPATLSGKPIHNVEIWKNFA